RQRPAHRTPDRCGRGGLLDDPDVDLPRERRQHRLARALRLSRRWDTRADRETRRCLAGHRSSRKEGPLSWVKVEAIVIRERVETVIDAVEEAGHVGVTVIEA